MGTYVFTPLNFATANSGTYASGINNAGQIVGYYVDSTGQDHDFLYSDGTFSTLAVPGTVDGNVGLGINSSGQVVGTYANGSIDQGFILSGSVFTTISDPTASLTFAAGINDASQIVGDVYVTFFESGTGYFGYLYSGGNYTQIQDPLTGEQVDSGRVYGTFPSAINAADQIVGTFRDFEGASHGFLYSNGTYTTLDDPSQGTLDGIGFGTFATGINNSGEIVGYYIDSSRVDHGFIYDDGVYTTVDVPGATDTFIYGINDSDEIVGSFVTGTTPEGFSATLQNPGNVNTDEWMLANGHWSASISPGPHPFGYGVAGIGNFTGSGTDGVLWFNAGTGDVDEWRISNGAWSASTDLGTHPGNYQIAGVGDFTGNGTDDVLWTSISGSGQVQTDIWELLNGQWAASVSPGAQAAGYYVAGTGDWTGNGTDGILWYNSNTGDVDEWQLSNGQLATTVDLGEHPGNYQIAGVGDFFGNGTDDILWTSLSASGQMQTDIWELGSNGQWIASVSPGSHPAGYQVVGVGEFTGNGTSDILWQNLTTGDVDEWLIKNGQWAGSVDLGVHPGNYQIAGTGDFTGNGTSGILWHS